MMLETIIDDIHAMNEDLLMFERKYGVLTETFYAAYKLGEEPEDDAWVLDWSEWAGTYEILLHRRAKYQEAVDSLLKHKTVQNVSNLISRAARHEPIAIPA